MIQSKKPVYPLSKFKIGIGAITIASIYGFFRYGLYSGLLVTSIGLFVVFLYLIVLELFEKYFDGWEIKEDSVILSRVSFFGRTDKKLIKFKEINSILYIKPAAYRTFSFKLKTNKETLTLMPAMDIYNFGETLKHLKDKGITIDFLESDRELELYLNDRIEAIPMTNDMKIKN
ncbi:MAG: hypothetical protein CMC96_02070 [Flavobacteriales bacterium]|nr:hypothetical protein [Flavobacteriales bacterium]